MVCWMRKVRFLSVGASRIGEMGSHRPVKAKSRDRNSYVALKYKQGRMMIFTKIWNKSTNKLTRKFKSAWVKALRSGVYKQGRNQLRNPRNEFCCLGVAADVFNPERWLKTDRCRYEDSSLSLPSRLLPDEFQDILATMNDTDRNDFNEIADFIEANY